MISNFKDRYPGFDVIATTAHKKTAIFEEKLDSACMVLIGNETEGLCKQMYELADKTVTIPMAETSSASSFNVACAATVILYEITRQRKKTNI
jgi:TrmH family RNA methyltransferase